MTKDKLEQEFEDDFEICTHASEGGYGADTTDMYRLWDLISPKISEYVKTTSLAYDQWKIDNRWFSFENGYWYQTHEQGTAMSEKTYNKHHRKTPQELYNQFIEQQNKP
jgi:hypothetical protein